LRPSVTERICYVPFVLLLEPLHPCTGISSLQLCHACKHVPSECRNAMQDVSGWKLYEHVNGGAATLRFTFGDGTTFASGQAFGVCNPGASAFLKGYCNGTAPIGINGDDSLVLQAASGQVQVRDASRTCAASVDFFPSAMLWLHWQRARS
jgi:hypothetical protein